MPYRNSIFGSAIYWGIIALAFLLVLGPPQFTAGHYLFIILGLFLFNTILDTLSFFVKWGGKAREIANTVFYSFFGLVFFLALLTGSTSFVVLLFLVVSIGGIWFSLHKYKNTTVPSKEYKQIH